MKIRLRCLLILVLACLILPAGCQDRVRTEHPFVGITHIQRLETSPRPLRIHVVLVDLDAPGLHFLVTPPTGHAPRETVRQTTREFLVEHHAQVAINGHFFSPWPTMDPEVDLKGLAASNGLVYSAFEKGLGYPFQDDLPAINLAADNTPTIVHQAADDASGLAVRPPVRLYNALCGNEQVLTDGADTAATGKWDETLNPRTAIGIAPRRTLVLLIVDGRQPGVSEGMTTGEMARFLARRYGVTDAINLDGGGSTTLVMADPTPLVVNVPVGIDNKPGTERSVGSNLGVLATARRSLVRPGGPRRLAGS